MCDDDPAWFHTRVLTGVALTQLFELTGLPVVERFSSGYHPLPSALAERVARRDFRHAAFHRRRRAEAYGRST